MLRRIIELLRAVAISPETLLVLLVLWGLSFWATPGTLIGSFVHNLGSAQSLWIPGMFGGAFVFCLKNATSILRPSDANTQALRGWTGFYILEMRVKATLIWSGLAVLVSVIVVLSATILGTELMGRLLLAAATATAMAGYSIWEAELTLHRLIATARNPN